MINYDVPLNSRGNNANLRANVLDDQTIKSYGFNQGIYWEYLGCGVTMYIKVSKDSICIDIIDDDFGQPYDYQVILRNDQNHKAALSIHSKVQVTMKRLSDAGIIEGWVVNDYI